MVSLMDTAPLRTAVKVGDGHIDVRGLGVDSLSWLILEFPEVKQALRADGDISLDAFTVEGLLARAPAFVHGVIAAGCGHAGDPAAVQKAAGLPLGAQAKLLAAILKLTMPEGIVPFLQEVRALVATVSVTGIKGPSTN